MICFHELKEIDIDLTDAISRHSADEGVVYKTVNGEPIYLGYYFPKNYDKQKKYPTFLFIHGGGWCSHTIFEEQPHWQGDYLGYLARYYADKGMICVSIDYRLAVDCGQNDGYGIIDCYEDCCDAVDYVLGHADAYGVNIENMYLLGESAGGHLAGAVTTFHYDRKYSFQKVILVNAITHLEDDWKDRVPVNTTHPKLADLSFAERAAFLAPLYQISDETGDVVLIHGESDTVVNREHSVKFYDRMKELGKNCELHTVRNTNHAFLLAEYTPNIMACKVGINIINNHLC